MKQQVQAGLLLLGGCGIMVSPAIATEDPVITALDDYKAGYSNKPLFGGPNSPEGQLEEDDRIKEPVFRFDEVHDVFKPWNDWKRSANEEHGFQITLLSNIFKGLNGSKRNWQTYLLGSSEPSSV